MRALIFSLLAIQSFVAYPMNPQNMQKQAVIDDAAKKLAASLPDPEIEQLIKESVEKSEIKEKVIALQRNNGDNSYAGKLINNPYHYIALGVQGKTLQDIESAAYHECGHIKLGHVSDNTHKKEAWLIRSGQITSLSLAALAFYKTFKNFGKSYFSKFARSSIVSFITLCGSLAPFLAYKKYQKHNIEVAADKFMYDQFIKQKKIGAICGQVSDYLFHHEFLPRDLHWVATGYPSNFKRAQIGLQALVEQGYNIKQLLENMPADTDPGVKENFAKQIQKYFPDYLKK
jgi:hypothetical protein